MLLNSKVLHQQTGDREICACSFGLMFVSLTAVVVEDVGEAVKNAVTTATVGAAFLDPLPVGDQATVPAERKTVDTAEPPMRG